MASILITGAHHEDRVRYATSLSMKFLCDQKPADIACGRCGNCERVVSRCHPNITYIEPMARTQDDEALNADNPKLEIKIADIRRVIQESHKTNYEKGTAIFIISHMHLATKAAANALLKVIEESQEDKSFLALAPSRTSVLPTIASRLLSHIVRPEPNDRDGISFLQCEQIWQITKTPPKMRFALCEPFNLSRGECIEEVQKLTTACHALLWAYFEKDSKLHAHGLPPAVALRLSDALAQAHEQLLRNLNPRLVGENLILCKWPYAKPTHAHAD